MEGLSVLQGGGGGTQEVGPIKIATGYDGQLAADWEESVQIIGGREASSRQAAVTCCTHVNLAASDEQERIS